MALYDVLRSYKNSTDFYLRNLLRFPLPVEENEPTHELAKRLQIELEEFLKLFLWARIVPKRFSNKKKLVICDVGTRIFAIAPVLHQLFADYNFEPEVHGLEIDPFRRFTNFRSRADYGHYYAKKIPRGYFHAMDFLNWHRALDVALILNPFVTQTPLLEWGLPLKEFKPQQIFCHAHKLVKDSKGLLVASSPNAEEFELVLEYASRAGFELLQETKWEPLENSTQKQPRFGGLFLTHST